MKNLRTIACCLSITFCSLATSAQLTDIPFHEPDMNKPELFHQSPDKISIEVPQLSNLVNAVVGDPVVIDLPSFRFEGTVISSVSKYSNTMQSVVVRSTNHTGATFTLTRITEANGNIRYSGRILSMNHGDLYQLKQVDNGLALVKNKLHKVVNE